MSLPRVAQCQYVLSTCYPLYVFNKMLICCHNAVMSFILYIVISNIFNNDKGLVFVIAFGFEF